MQINNELADLMLDAIRDYADYKNVKIQSIDVRAHNNILTVFLCEDNEEEDTHEFQFKSGVLAQYKNKSIVSVDMNAESFLTDPIGASAARLLIDAAIVNIKSEWIEIQ